MKKNIAFFINLIGDEALKLKRSFKACNIKRRERS